MNSNFITDICNIFCNPFTYHYSINTITRKTLVDVQRGILARRERTSFHFDKTGVLHRTKVAEYWEGVVKGKPAIIKRFAGAEESSWREFILQSRIRHSILMPATHAGITSGDRFAYSMPLDFSPVSTTNVTDPLCFATQMLSLAMALHNRGFSFRRDSFLLQDKSTGQVFLPGINMAREKTDGGARLLGQIREAIGDGSATTEVLKTLRKWERRKENPLAGCLAELMRSAAISPVLITTWFEMPRTRELELVGGLLQLVRQSRGRALLFRSDPGGGKSSLLHQVYKDLLMRDVDVVFHQAPRELRPFCSIRILLEAFLEQCGGSQGFGSEFSISRMRNRKEMLDVPEEAIVADLLRLMERLRGETDRTFVFLIDDLDGFDPQSLCVIGRLIRSLPSAPLLLAATCTNPLLDLPEALVPLQVETLDLASFEQACVAPLWKKDQQSRLIAEVYRQTSGNPLLFHETFTETLRLGQKSMRWHDDGEWSFNQVKPASLPRSVATFYLDRLPALSLPETNMLEAAAVQGCTFDPSFLDIEEPLRHELLGSLREKGVLVESHENFRFLRPVFAEYFYEKLEDSRRKTLHLELAARLATEGSARRHAEIARHFLKAGEYEEALNHARKASAQIRFNTAQVVLPILDELQQNGSLEPSLRRVLLCEKAQLLFRRGKYPAAAETFHQALKLLNHDEAGKFEVQVEIAESLYYNNDIHGALHALREAEQNLNSITDPGSLIRFYLCRGCCGWQRGRQERKDFEKAMELAEEQQDYEALARGHRQLAELEFGSGTLANSRAMAAKSLKYARKNGSHLECGHAYRLLGKIAWHRSLHRTAARILQRSIRHFSRAGSLDGVARVWSLLGNVHVEQYRFTEATAAFEKASALFSQLDHPLEVSLAQFNLGLVYIEQGRLKEAEKIYQRCRAMDRKTGNKRYYAYDLRALAVVAILRGFHRKATHLLNRTLEICNELKVDGDILQTQMIQLMNELEQKNYRPAKPLIELLQSRLESLQEPMARAEIHYLLGHYHGYINETETALHHLDEALRIARKIRYYKLMGMSLMLRLIFRNAPPRRGDRDIHRAIACFLKGQNELRLSDYLLKLYQAYPSLLKEREHALRLAKMEKLYRRLRHRANHRLVRQLAVGSRKVAPEPLYDWWYSLLQVLHGEGELEAKIQKALILLSEELHSSASGFWFKDALWMRFHYPLETHRESSLEFHEAIWKRTASTKEAICIDLSYDAELAAYTRSQLNDIGSVIAVPLLQDGRMLGMWYFERWRPEASFTRKEMGKAAFFAMASLPIIVQATQALAAHSNPDGDGSRIDDDLVGKSPAMQVLQRQMARLAPLDISVLIQGESGTGKELIARGLHRNSPRSGGPFVALNCSAIPESLLESELFGYAKGAFTGATATKQGSIERANGGTLFLDEIGDLSVAAQAKLLRVMQEKEIQRVGETTPRKVDVRFLFATHKDLKKMVKEGAYREDLFYRISVYSLHVPPLRERGEDIALLLSHFTAKYAQAFARKKVQYAPAAMQALCEYSWPGNVREMENAVQTLLVNVESGGRIELKDLSPQVKSGTSFRAASGMTLEEARQDFERDFLRQCLDRNGWNKTQTAKELGITRQGLIQMITRLGIEK